MGNPKGSILKTDWGHIMAPWALNCGGAPNQQRFPIGPLMWLGCLVTIMLVLLQPLSMQSLIPISQDECCLIAAGDLVIDKTGDVGMVVRVFQRVSDSLIFLEVDAYPCVGGNISCRATDRAYKDFFVSTTIVEQLIWYFDSPGIVRFSIPAPLLYQE